MKRSSVAQALAAHGRAFLALIAVAMFFAVSASSAIGDSFAVNAGTTLELSPVNAVNAVGTEHTVTARLGASGGVIAGAHVHFDVTGANATSGDTTTDASGEASFTYTGANAGTDTIRACFDANDDQQCGGDELSVNATKRFVVAGAGQAGVTLGVTPLTAVNPVGTQHTVTASLSGGTVSDQKIHFAVSGANSATGDATTDASGHAGFTYTGT